MTGSSNSLKFNGIWCLLVEASPTGNQDLLDYRAWSCGDGKPGFSQCLSGSMVRGVTLTSTLIPRSDYSTCKQHPFMIGGLGWTLHSGRCIPSLQSIISELVPQLPLFFLGKVLCIFRSTKCFEYKSSLLYKLQS